MRERLIVPDAPLLLPAVKLKVNVALVQLWNASVPLPTATVFGAGLLGALNTPPVVSYICSGIDRVPAANVACPVYQR